MYKAIILLTAIILCIGCNKGTGSITQNEVDGTVSAPGLSAPADDTASLQMPEVETKPSLPEKDFVFTESGFIYTEDGSFYPDVVNGIWENRKEGVRFPMKGSNFSWGENVWSLSSLVIDLKPTIRGDPPVFTMAYSAFHIIQKVESQGNQVILTIVRSTSDREPDPDDEGNEIIITIIDENTISIYTEYSRINRSMGRFPPGDDNPNNYYYRVPFDAPYEPYPGEDM
jgi:hypothetical protein